MDGKWSIFEHFARQALRLNSMATMLGRLHPNGGGSGVAFTKELCDRSPYTVHRCRRARWRPTAKSSESFTVRKSGFPDRPRRTISFATATILAGDPLAEITARSYADTYRHSIYSNTTPLILCWLKQSAHVQNKALLLSFFSFFSLSLSNR